MGTPCDVDPDGTYFEAEDESTIVNSGATYEFSGTSTAKSGYQGSGYLSSGSETQNQLDYNHVNSNPGLYERYDYDVNFTTAGTYNLWIRARGDDSDENTIFIGLDGVAVGSIGEDVFGQWVWDNLIQNGTNQIAIGSPGPHTISIWRRETGHRLDAIYLTKTGTVPSGGVPSGASVIDPSMCSW
jgi:hypothetical protein